MFTKSRRIAQLAAAAEREAAIADAAHAARVANLRLRREAARRETQERFDVEGLPRFAYQG
jgi:hypothetical protein